MKIKITLTTLSAIVALAMMPIFAFSQNDSTANAPENFSTWSVTQNMGLTLNSADNDIAPVASPSGLSLYFTSNRSGGQGLNDIYVSQHLTLSSAWGAPQNLGATVNTRSVEVAASFSLDGREMFLQSMRPGGMGGNDLYISTRTDPNNDFGWTATANLGAVINTAFAESSAFYFEDLTNGVNTLIFASDRNGADPQLFQSTRNANGTFNAPTPITELNGAMTAQLRPAIRRDGLEILFGSVRLG